MDTQLIAKLLRYYSLVSTSQAGSGHPTSCLSGADLMAVLYFQYFKFDFENPNNRFNDRLIFSKGHAAPLLYSLYKVAGKISEEQLLSLRTIDSPFQGHPTPETPYVDVATGSLGMGLSFGVGMALASHMDKIPNKIYVLLGDGEMAEGNIWEAIQVAAHYKLNNLVGILDANRLAENGETMVGHHMDAYASRIRSFGWNTVVIDGHNHREIIAAIENAHTSPIPTMMLAKTYKGKGVSFLENKEGRHGKALKNEELAEALSELNVSDAEKQCTFGVRKPEETDHSEKQNMHQESIDRLCEQLVNANEPVPIRKAYGMALAQLAENNKSVTVCDADLFDATFSGLVREKSINQFINMFIAEQNMVAAAVGLSKMGRIVFSSTFGAFLTRAYDQIRMASLSETDMVLCGSHAGVAVGEDGASQMGLEDIAMMRAVYGSTVVYPSDAISAIRLTNEIATRKGIQYIRTTRPLLPILYTHTEQFPVGGSKTLRVSPQDVCTVVAAGITVHEALKAYDTLKNENIQIRVIDMYSIKPIDESALHTALSETNNKIIVVEDHYAEGGLGDAVLSACAEIPCTIYKMAIIARPHSGNGFELLKKYGISSEHIVAKVKAII